MAVPWVASDSTAAAITAGLPVVSRATLTPARVAETISRRGGGHHRGQADGARAPDSDPAARADRHRVQDRARPGLHAAGEPGQVAQRRVGRDRHDVPLGDEGVGGERGLAEEGGADRPAVLPRPGRAVRPGAGERHRDDLVAEDDREDDRQPSEPGVVVGVADADGHVLDQDLVVARVVEVELLDRQLRARLPGDGGLDLHAFPLIGGAITAFRRKPGGSSSSCPGARVGWRQRHATVRENS